MLFGYGYMTLPIFLISVFLLVVFASYVYFFTAESSGNFGEDLATSAHNMLSPWSFKSLIDRVVALVQTCFGILILGFLGFIFANKVRNDG